MLRVASFFDTKHHIGEVVAISRSQPKIRKKSPIFYALVPPYQLLNSYRNGHISWERYVIEYCKMLEERKAVIQRRLAKLPPNKDVTFCCWEADPSKCHRSLSAAFIRELGFEVEVF